jgi:hypothetical protein
MAGSLEAIGGQPGGAAVREFLAISFNDDGTLKTGVAGDRLGLTPTAVKTAPYTAVAGDLVPVDTTSGAVTVTLPTAPADGAVVCVKQITRGGTNTVTVACGGSDVFNKAAGATSATLTLLAQAMLVQYKTSGAIWFVVTDDLALSQLDLRYVQDVGGGLEGVNVAGNSGSSATIALTAGNVQTYTINASCTFTMPSGLTSGVGLSFTVILTDSGGSHTVAFTGVKWASGAAPTFSTTAGSIDIFTFVSVNGGTTWYGFVGGQAMA